MNLLRIILFLAVILPSTASSYREEPMELELTLAWDDPNWPGTIAGYVVYQRIGVDWLELGRTERRSFPVTLHRSVTTFAVSCYNSAGRESERSAEVTVRWPTKDLPWSKCETK